MTTKIPADFTPKTTLIVGDKLLGVNSADLATSGKMKEMLVDVDTLQADVNETNPAKAGYIKNLPNLDVLDGIDEFEGSYSFGVEEDLASNNFGSIGFGMGLACAPFAMSSGGYTISGINVPILRFESYASKGTWISMFYDKNDIVDYSGTLYIAKTEHSSSSSPDSDTTNWEVFSKTIPTGVEQWANFYFAGDKRLFLKGVATWSDTTWKEDAISFYNDNFYQCNNEIESATGLTPDNDSSNWGLLPALPENKIILQAGSGLMGDMHAYYQKSELYFKKVIFVDYDATNDETILTYWNGLDYDSSLSNNNDGLTAIACNNSKFMNDGFETLLMSDPDSFVMCSNAEGLGTTATGFCSKTSNFGSIASKACSSAQGVYSKSNFYGSVAHSSTCEVQSGEEIGEAIPDKLQQYERIVVDTTTEGAASSNLSLINPSLSVFSGSRQASNIVIPSGSLFRFTAEISGMETTTGEDVAYTVKGAINTKLTTPALTWSNVTTDYENADLNGCDVSVSMGSSNNLEISCAGVADKTIKWVATIHFTEVK